MRGVESQSLGTQLIRCRHSKDRVQTKLYWMRRILQLLFLRLGHAGVVQRTRNLQFHTNVNERSSVKC